MTKPSHTPHCGSCGSLSFFAGQPVHTSDCPAASPATHGEDLNKDVSSLPIAGRKKHLHEDMDALRWTREFMENNPNAFRAEIDEGTMLGWFSNAIMCGFDEANRRASARSETPRNAMAVQGCEPIKSPANVLALDSYAEAAGKALAESLDKDEIEIRRAASATSAIPRSEPDEDGERYRWFRNECAWFRRADIVEVAGEDAAMLDHYIDKGRCGL